MQDIERSSRERDPSLRDIQRLAVQCSLIQNLAFQKSIAHVTLDLAQHRIYLGLRNLSRHQKSAEGIYQLQLDKMSIRHGCDKPAGRLSRNAMIHINCHVKRRQEGCIAVDHSPRPSLTISRISTVAFETFRSLEP